MRTAARAAAVAARSAPLLLRFAGGDGRAVRRALRACGRTAQRSLRANRMHTSTFRTLAISQWQLGRHDDARATVGELMRVEPDLTVTRYRERHPSGGYETGKIWSSALEGAGVPL